jgi:hypothetical protein
MTGPEELVEFESRLARAVGRETRTLQAALKEKDDALEHLVSRLRFAEMLDQAKMDPPKWLSPKRPSPKKGIACALLTDTHFDEVVSLEEVGGLNKFDRRIAEMRLQRFVEQLIKLARDYIHGIEYGGLALFVGGDIFSGSIHEELKETNEATLLASLVHWVEPIIAALTLLKEEFGNLHVAVTIGNHGRSTRKPRAKHRAEDNIEWALWRIVAREMGPLGIKFNVPTSMDTRVTVLNTRYVLTHGDNFRGGTGISGIYTPLMLGKYRKTVREMAAGADFDWLILGHFHQLIFGNGFIVGGSLKGYDEYAYSLSLPPEPPQQAFWVTDPVHGVTVRAPILVGDRKQERW